jgi:2-C-methyl-D-erythritol 2,4-cyclodiphosphate synthase
MRIGTALDVHAFEPAEALSGECLQLGLVAFESLPKLAGHSDGDVVAHAIADALLLASSQPDLGSTIGVDKPEWKNASGEQILKHVLGIIQATGYTPHSVSAQIVAKRPRLQDAFPQMRALLSEAIGVDVNVGATTTDGQIPDLGDGKAIACIASVLVKRLPTR